MLYTNHSTGKKIITEVQQSYYCGKSILSPQIAPGCQIWLFVKLKIILLRFENEKDFDKLGRTFYGVIGAGTIGINRVPPPSKGVICTTTRSHSNRLVNAALEAVSPTEVLRVGGSGHKVLLLIEGKAHAYVFPSPGCKKWDTCAPEAILHALGGKVSTEMGIYSSQNPMFILNTQILLQDSAQISLQYYPFIVLTANRFQRRAISIS